jgi:integrase
MINGKYMMSDAVRSAFWRVQQATRINGNRGFYCFRKTGATLIESLDPSATEMYLSHACQATIIIRHQRQLEFAMTMMVLPSPRAAPVERSETGAAHAGEPERPAPC